MVLIYFLYLYFLGEFFFIIFRCRIEGDRREPLAKLEHGIGQTVGPVSFKDFCHLNLAKLHRTTPSTFSWHQTTPITIRISQTDPLWCLYHKLRDWFLGGESSLELINTYKFNLFYLFFIKLLHFITLEINHLFRTLWTDFLDLSLYRLM